MLHRLMGCACGKERITVDGRVFTVIDCIGEGGFSYVFLVHERGDSRRRFALKRIDCHSHSEQQRALDEVTLHTRLSGNEYVLPVETHSVDQPRVPGAISQVLIVLPYLKRGTLADELALRAARKDYMDEKRVLRLFTDICNGLRAFHSLKPEPFAHRDLKTANVLLADDDKAVLMDLGSARPARVYVADSRQAQIMQDEAAEHCSMCYRAPELFNVTPGATISERTDLWSLGCVLFALCFFQSPFDSVHERGDSVALAVQSGRVNIPQVGGYNDSLIDLIRSLLNLDPSQRPTVDSIIWQLDSIAPSSPGVESPPDPGPAQINVAMA